MSESEETKKMLEKLHELQESAKENQPGENSFLQKEKDSITECHLAQTKSEIEDIDADPKLSEKEKEEYIKELNEEKAKISGLI
ncbi:MAG: hypothetical protein LUD76_05760 [Alistipes sp.]|nr:hypothetical protein [Alistipes sp.]